MVNPTMLFRSPSGRLEGGVPSIIVRHVAIVAIHFASKIDLPYNNWQLPAHQLSQDLLYQTTLVISTT